MPRNVTLARVLGELRQLQNSRRGATLRELADQASVSERTIRRDLEALQAAGVPQVDERGEDGRVRWRVLDWRKEAA
jgi:predicted DNA-binding transcriptional regulator YafY